MGYVLTVSLFSWQATPTVSEYRLDSCITDSSIYLAHRLQEEQDPTASGQYVGREQQSDARTSRPCGQSISQLQEPQDDAGSPTHTSEAPDEEGMSERLGHKMHVTFKRKPKKVGRRFGSLCSKMRACMRNHLHEKSICSGHRAC